MKQTKLIALRAKLHAGYAMTEHGCAIAYAVCEFAQVHVIIAICALLLLGLGELALAETLLERL